MDGQKTIIMQLQNVWLQYYASRCVFAVKKATLFQYT